MHRTRKRLSILFAMALGALAPAHAQTTPETLQLDSGTPADSVTAIIRSLAPISGQTGPPPASVQPLPDVFLPPIILGRPTTVIIDRRPIVLDYRYSLDLTIYFAYDSAFLTPPAREHLALVGQALRSPELANNRYLIAGHTDARGPDDYNTDLSYRRAWAVKRFLMRHYGIASWRLEVVGWGERYPRDPYDPYSAVNRRVEITLIDIGQPIVPQQPAPQQILPPQVSGYYIPALPACPAGVSGITGSTVPDLDDFTPEPGVDCDPSLPRKGAIIVGPDGRMIVQQ
jgi:outer membrane protein OmpA-like peptidoglycan-associated protein